jgi:putative peptidoglycan lipid II flippase
MGFATTLVQFPLGLIAAGVGAAVLPPLSRHAAETAGLAFQATLTDGLRLVLVLILPATVGLALLREPLIALLFQRGAFDGAAAARTATAFLAYAPGLPAAAIDQVLIFGFYARQRTLAPVLVGVAAVGVYLVVGLALIGPLGMPGLALANSAQWVAHMVIMALLTRRTSAPPFWADLRGTLARCTVGVAVLALVVVATRPGTWEPARGTPDAAIALAPALVLGAAAYLLALAVVGRQELGLLLGALRRRPPE